MWERLKSTLSEPRLVTGATVGTYLVLLALGVDLIPTLALDYAPILWVPAIMMIVGALVGLPCAWIGGRAAARWELVSMPISIAGLLGGVVIEASEIWADFASHVLLALGAVVLIAVIARWVWLYRHYDI